MKTIFMYFSILPDWLNFLIGWLWVVVTLGNMCFLGFVLWATVHIWMPWLNKATKDNVPITFSQDIDLYGEEKIDGVQTDITVKED